MVDRGITSICICNINVFDIKAQAGLFFEGLNLLLSKNSLQKVPLIIVIANQRTANTRTLITGSSCNLLTINC